MAEVNRRDFSSLQQAVDSLPSGSHSSITVPAGIWDETNRVHIPSDKTVSILGQGIDRSVLRWSSTDGGIVVNVVDYQRSFVLKDISLETTVNGGGIALETIHPSANASPYRTVDLSALSVRPASATGGYWSHGLVLSNAWNGRVEGFHFVGKNGTHDSKTAIFLKGTTVNFLISNFHAVWVETALRTDSATGDISEGISLVSGKLVDVGCGVWLQKPGGGLTLVGVHIDARDAGVVLFGRDDMELTGLSIYSRNSNPNFLGILIDGGWGGRIFGNVIHRASGTGSSPNGIVLTEANNFVVNGNTITGMDTAVWLKSKTRNNLIANNLSVGCGTSILNQGTGNSETGNYST